jgi:hypothetical protein
MDILSFALVGTGAFGAGLTVGAMVFSPRLMTRTDLAPAQHGPPAVVYAIPAAPAGPPVLPPGYVMIPGGYAVADRSAHTSGNRIRGIRSRNDRDHDPSSGVRSISPFVSDAPAVSSDSWEVDQ